MPKIEAFLATEAAEGRQAFVVVPLVAESDALQAASAEAEAERLRAALPQLRIGIVHGQQKADLRDATMTAFAAGEMDLLVATTVIEVGIDVPNASVIVIEDAERFGLAQLHQLRGRVGRGTQRSFCILLSDATDDLAVRRLEVVRGSNDGFAIAEADLASARRRQPARHPPVRAAAAPGGVPVRSPAHRARAAGARAGRLASSVGIRRWHAGRCWRGSRATSHLPTEDGDAA